jgi:DNA-binding NarL/FixJ family response regulator
VVRDGFARAVADEADIEVVGDASTAADGLAGAQAARPDVILVDLSLPDRDGTELIADLRAALPDARVVVLSGHSDDYRVAEALRAGAHGYLLKTSPLDAIKEGVRTAAAGGTPLSPTLTEAVMRTMRRSGRAGSGTIECLTARELEVLRHFASGLNTREVAEKLGISPKTVETHRIRIYEKLGCRSVVDLTRIAVRTGLVRA